MVRFEPLQGDAQIIDVFERGRLVARAEAEAQVSAALNRPAAEDDFAPATKRAIIVRMLHNLLGAEQKAGNIDGMLKYLGAILAIAPDAGRERFMRGVLYLESGRRAEARADADWLLQHRPEGVNLNEVDELRRVLDRLNR
jgi:regulator of sirC expression with transglutaminase-like and TPR domain